MKLYIEAIEQTEEQESDFIKEEVTPDTEIDSDKEWNGKKIKIRTYKQSEKDKSLDKVKAKEKSGKTYKYREHTCNHDEGKSCTVEAI